MTESEAMNKSEELKKLLAPDFDRTGVRWADYRNHIEVNASRGNMGMRVKTAYETSRGIFSIFESASVEEVAATFRGMFRAAQEREFCI